MTTPHLALPAIASRARTAPAALAPRLAYPALLAGLGLAVLGYLAAAVLLLQLVVRTF